MSAQLLVLFILGFVTDVTWCSLVKAVSRKEAVKSSFLSVILEGIKLGTAWIVITNDSLSGAVSFLIGCGLGTWLSTRYR